MKHKVLIAFLICIFATVCQASDKGTSASTAATSSAKTAETAEEKQALREEIYARAKKRNGGKEPTKLELFNELMQKGAEQVGAIQDFGKPRVVARGAKPEIIIKGDQILINRKSIMIGESVNAWRKVLGPETRRETGLYTTHFWDILGIQVLLQNGQEKVDQFKIYLNIEPLDELFPEKSRPYLPRHPFPGYLELDGYGIDAKTKFWEIRARVDTKRNLHCGSRDCSHPFGSFSDTGTIYMRLNSSNEYGNLYEFSISGDEATETAPKK